MSNDKLSIEFLPNDITKTVLPTIDGDNMTWDNFATIHVTWPINDTAWTNSRLIADSNGAAVAGLRTWLIDNEDFYTRFQPITVMAPAGQSNSVMWGEGPSIAYPAMDANFLVQNILNELAGSLNINLQCFTPVFTTYFAYYSLNTAEDLRGSQIVYSNHPEVIEWYRNLTTCYQTKYSLATKESEYIDGFVFFDLLQECYGDEAYVYYSPTEVINVSLGLGSPTPELIRYEFDLPEPKDTAQVFGADDYIIIVFLLGSVCGGIGYFIYRINNKPQEKHRLRITNSTVVRSGAFASVLGVVGTPTLSKLRQSTEESPSPRVTGSSGRKSSEDFSNVVISSFESNSGILSGGSAFPYESSLDVREGAYQNFDTPKKNKKPNALMENPGITML